MFTWIANNIWTILICAVLAVIVALVIVSLVKERQVHLRLQLCPLCHGGHLPLRKKEVSLPEADRRCTLPGTIALCDPGIMRVPGAIVRWRR